ncbi:MAG: Gx transporter family protein [Oscillospiraceae bacterium]|jgi:heptaprenyl diphosphate synthase|nr:Gx transporter family protein [Oscillospiraceae bacterium]
MEPHINRTSKAAHKAALLGVLAALALALSFAESVLLPALPLGIKPGLSNVAVMLASASLGLPAGLAIALVKAAFAGITRGLQALLLSGAGGLCSTLLAGCLLRRKPAWLSPIGIGMLGGVAHNLAQLCVAALLLRAPGVFGLAPPLLVAGAAAGAITGLLLRLLRKTPPE